MKYINNDKLEKIRLHKENFYVAIDFDRTITTLESADSWDIAGRSLGEEFNTKIFELYQKYRPIELDYNLSFKEKNKAMEQWYRDCVDLYFEYNFKQEQLQKSMETTNLIFRKGAKEFLEYTYKNNIPVVILSAGIGNVIKLFLEKNDCKYENIFIISNFIQFDKNGNMIKFDGQLIHTMNKTMKGSLTPEIEEKLKERKYRLLLGDTIEDKNMIPYAEWDKTITIRIFK